jgi:hypothetical protein
LGKANGTKGASSTKGPNNSEVTNRPKGKNNTKGPDTDSKTQMLHQWEFNRCPKTPIKRLLVWIEDQKLKNRPRLSDLQNNNNLQHFPHPGQSHQTRNVISV